MTQIDCTQPQPHATSSTNPRRAALSSASRRSIRIAAYDGVTAAYIHEISPRHRRRAAQRVLGDRREEPRAAIT
jgi:hypothetical protein